MQRHLSNALLAVLLAAGAAACAPPVVDVPYEEDDGAIVKGKSPTPDRDPNGNGSGTGSNTKAPDGGAGAPPGADYQDPALDASITAAMTATHTPGVAAIIIKGGKVRFAKGYGFAHLGNKTPVRADTLFMLASISKTITGAALMQLVEKGAIGLDDDVGAVAGFPVRNPAFPNAKITSRQLLSHTSSLGNDPVDRQVTGDSPIALASYVRGFVTPRAEYWTPDNFAPWAPGDRFYYSNNGLAAVAYLVQAKSGVPFEDYTRTNIFDPLRMKDLSWRLSGVDRTRLAQPYVWSATGGHSEFAHFGYPDWPAGQLRTSAVQLGSFLRMMAGKGVLDGVRVLKEESVNEMLKPVTKRFGDDQGLVWFDRPIKTRHVFGHGGAGPGVATYMGFDPKDGTGAILLSNGNAFFEDAASSNAFLAIFDSLIAAADKI